jgi:hypothetical protein
MTTAPTTRRRLIFCIAEPTRPKWSRMIDVVIAMVTVTPVKADAPILSATSVADGDGYQTQSHNPYPNLNTGRRCSAALRHSVFACSYSAARIAGFDAKAGVRAANHSQTLAAVSPYQTSYCCRDT